MVAQLQGFVHVSWWGVQIRIIEKLEASRCRLPTFLERFFFKSTGILGKLWSSLDCISHYIVELFICCTILLDAFL